jgi:exodeoxyribonuclease VII large subunit
MDDATDAPASNVPEYTVSEISGAVKRTLEGAFGRVRVRGEITELKRYPSGHIYFSLKDEGGKLASVVWKFSAHRLGLEPENGLEVVATGKISSYGDRSTYQLVVERMEYAGVGALLARIEMLRLRLAAEGVFDAARKRILPLLPRVVGVVSSPQGAVIQDIRTTILRRFPRHILLWPVPVQGEGAAARIAAAIAGFDALPAGGVIPRPDVLIVARGGGSLEDLMAFNDEAVVRAAAACRIPLISAVGHETDTTLIDHAADRRAPTPTAAAELAVPSRTELAADLQQKSARLLGALNRLAQERRLQLQRAERGLPDLPALLGTARQRLDDRAHRLRLALPGFVASRRVRLVAVERHLVPPAASLAAARSSLVLASAALRSALRQAVVARAATANRVLPRLSDVPLRGLLREARARLEGLASRLESVSHRAVLARGYAAVFDAADHPMTIAAAVKPGAALRIEFADGSVRATAAREARRGSGSSQSALPL